MRERKTFHFEVKAVDDAQGLIEAYGSVFNNIDFGDEYGRRDRVLPGSFKRTIQNSKAKIQAGKASFLAKMLWQHKDQELPLGGWYDLQEDQHGLIGKGKIVLETQIGREVYALIKEKVIDQFSIGYDVPQGGSEYNAEDSCRDLKEIRLWEISPVNFAMNDEALLVNVKAKQNMNKKARKDFNDHYRSEVIEDWLYCDFNNLTNALRAAILDMFSIGDEPQSDIETTVLNDGDDSPGFITALKAYVQKGIDLNVSNYLNELQQQGTGYGSPYYLMSRGKPAESKEGRAISAANQGHIQDHVNALNDLADKADSMMKEHTKAVRSAADDLATVLQGSEPLYEGSDNGTPDAGRQEGGKATPSPIETRSTQPEHSSEQDTAMSEQELDAAIRLLKSLYGTSVYS